MLIKNKIIATIAGVALMASVTTQSAKADFGITIGIGVAMATLGFIVGHHLTRPGMDVAPQMKYRQDSSDGNAQCASTYRSYEPSTGLITLNTGQKKICPFLQQ